MALDAVDRLDDLEPPLTGAAVPAVSGDGGINLSDSLDRRDDLETVFAAVTTPGPSQTITIPVGYAPDANAAVTITPGSLDASDVFTAGAITYGPYPAAVTLADGQYSLVVTTSDPVIGAVSIQPGDWAGGVFSPIGAALIGMVGTGDSSADSSLDWTITATGLFAGIGQPAVLPASAAQWVSLGIVVTDSLTGDPVALAANPNVASLAVALVRSDPAAGDWQPARVITRSAGDDLDGEYLQVKIGPGSALVLTPGEWDAYYQVTTAAEVLQGMSPNPLGII